MTLAPWYKQFLVMWLLAAVPIFVLAYGFADGHFVVPDPRHDDLAEVITVWAVWPGLLSPLPLAPFGIRRRKNNENSDRSD